MTTQQTLELAKSMLLSVYGGTDVNQFVDNLECMGFKLHHDGTSSNTWIDYLNCFEMEINSIAESLFGLDEHCRYQHNHNATHLLYSYSGMYGRTIRLRQERNLHAQG